MKKNNALLWREKHLGMSCTFDEGIFGGRNHYKAKEKVPIVSQHHTHMEDVAWESVVVR